MDPRNKRFFDLFLYSFSPQAQILFVSFLAFSPRLLNWTFPGPLFSTCYAQRHVFPHLHYNPFFGKTDKPVVLPNGLFFWHRYPP